MRQGRGGRDIQDNASSPRYGYSSLPVFSLRIREKRLGIKADDASVGLIYKPGR